MHVDILASVVSFIHNANKLKTPINYSHGGGGGGGEYTRNHRNLNTFVAVKTPPPPFFCRYFDINLLLIVCALR